MMKPYMLVTAGLGVVLVHGTTSTLNGMTLVDTTALWQGQAVGYWGDVATHGQTFTVGQGTRLDRFTFYVSHDAAYDPLTFAGYVMRWDQQAGHALGPVLFGSGVLRTTGSDVWEPITVETGGLHLTEGQQYVAFFSTWGIAQGGGRGWAGYAGEAYDGGTLVYNANGTDFSALTSTAWVTNYPGGDLAFRLVFNIPEPATLALLAMGGMVLVNRKTAGVTGE